MTLGAKLKEARKEAKLSQLNAATQANMEQATLWRYEADKHQPTQEVLERLAAIYQKSPNWFTH